MNAELVRTSKFLSLVLRHAPERIGLVLGVFFCAENGVWPTAHVAPRFLRSPE